MLLSELEIKDGRIITRDSDFVESEHPRESDGKFGEKGTSEVSKIKTITSRLRTPKAKQTVETAMNEIKKKIPPEHLKYVSEFVFSQTPGTFKTGGSAGKIGIYTKQEKVGPISIEIQYRGSDKILSKLDIEDIVSHEIGHKVFNKLDENTKKDWIKAGKQLRIGIDQNPWFRKNRPYVEEAAKNTSKITSKYIDKDETFAGELFSDLYSLYSRDPEKIKEYLKKRGESLAKIFGANQPDVN